MRKKQEFVRLVDAPKHIPGRPHRNSVRRWADRGYEGIVLKSWRVGRTRFTSLEAIDEFITATTELHSARAVQPAYRAAEKQLDSLGV